MALEVEVDSRSGSIRVLRAVASADGGHIVSHDGVSNQIEGGLVQSLSCTLKEEVQVDETRILCEDWTGCPISSSRKYRP
ncbi:MAG: molybdopterin cofactor-binding domain-containing protein [bacterium]